MKHTKVKHIDLAPTGAFFNTLEELEAFAEKYNVPVLCTENEGKTEEEKIKEYEQLLKDGLSEHEAKATAWPDEDNTIYVALYGGIHYAYYPKDETKKDPERECKMLGDLHNNGQLPCEHAKNCQKEIKEKKKNGNKKIRYK